MRVELDVEATSAPSLPSAHRGGPGAERGRALRTTICSGHRLHQAGADTGERWMLHDVSGKPISIVGQPRVPTPHDVRRASSPRPGCTSLRTEPSGWLFAPSMARARATRKQSPHRASTRLYDEAGSRHQRQLMTSRGICSRAADDLLPTPPTAIRPTGFRIRRPNDGSFHPAARTFDALGRAAVTADVAGRQRVSGRAFNAAEPARDRRRAASRRRGG